jgi:hypothetical protein
MPHSIIVARSFPCTLTSCTQLITEAASGLFTLLVCVSVNRIEGFYRSLLIVVGLQLVDAAHCRARVRQLQKNRPLGDQFNVSVARFRTTDSFVLFRTLSKLDLTPSTYRLTCQTGGGRRCYDDWLSPRRVRGAIPQLAGLHDDNIRLNRFSTFNRYFLNSIIYDICKAAYPQHPFHASRSAGI